MLSTKAAHLDPDSPDGNPTEVHYNVAAEESTTGEDYCCLLDSRYARPGKGVLQGLEDQSKAAGSTGKVSLGVEASSQERDRGGHHPGTRGSGDAGRNSLIRTSAPHRPTSEYGYRRSQLLAK